MEENVVDLSGLIQNWEDLYEDLCKNKRFSFELFEETFSQTYQLIKQYSNQPNIDKKYVSLITTAFLFSHAESKELDKQYCAALVLTERMLSCCAFNSASEPVEGTNVYIFEARREVRIDFNDVNGSVEKLGQLFEKEFWNNL